MKVSELMEKLSELDGDEEIFIYDMNEINFAGTYREYLGEKTVKRDDGLGWYIIV